MSTRSSGKTQEARYSAPALEKGLDVLELLAAQPHGLSLQEIATRLQRSSSELYRMLDVLVQRGYLARMPDASYGLTLRMFELAHRHPPVERLLGVAMPHMQELAQRSGQSNHLCVHHDTRLVVLARAEPPEPMSCLVRQGAHFAFQDDRVSARVISAFQGPTRHLQYLDELAAGNRSSAKRKAMNGRLEVIRRKGYDEGPSDTLSGVIDLCFPIFDHSGVVAALTLVYLKQRDARTTVPAARELLREISTTISRSLGKL